mgnify:CR=1 FL=1
MLLLSESQNIYKLSVVSILTTGGPRPLYPFYLPYYTEKESLRHSVRGGITGLAQVNGRALLRWNQRFEKDFEYVQKVTLIGDIKILWE